MKSNLHQALRTLGNAYHEGKLSKEDYRQQRRIELEALGNTPEEPNSQSALVPASTQDNKTNHKLVIVAAVLLAILIAAALL